MSVNVRHGVNTLSLDNLVGKTVGDVRDQVEDLINVPESAQVRLNGSPVGDDATIPDHATIEFVKVAGEKGRAA